MRTVSDLLKNKGGQVHTIELGATVLQAAKRMNEHRIGSLVVTESDAVAGILTERDILTRIVAVEFIPSRTLVEEVMTRRVIVCGPGTDLDELRAVMRQKRIRHVPVVHEGRLLGLVSLGDLNLAAQETLVETIEYLESYIRQG